MGTDKEFKWGSAVNQELAANYAHWHNEGEKRVARDITIGKRTRTQLETMAKSFGHVLRPEQLLAFRAAQSAVSHVITDLEALKPYIKARSRWKAEKTEWERNERLDRLAADRWTSDADMVAEARELVAFYANGADGDDVEAFILALHPGHTNVVRDTMFSESQTAQHELPAALENADMVSVRRHAAYVLSHMDKVPIYSRDTWYAVAADYEKWRKLGSAARILSTETLGGMTLNRSL